MNSRSRFASRPTSGPRRTVEADAPVHAGAGAARAELLHQLARIRRPRRDQAPAHRSQPVACDVLASAVLRSPRRTRLLTAPPGARSGLRTAPARARLALLRLLPRVDARGPAAGCHHRFVSIAPADPVPDGGLAPDHLAYLPLADGRADGLRLDLQTVSDLAVHAAPPCSVGFTRCCTAAGDPSATGTPTSKIGR